MKRHESEIAAPGRRDGLDGEVCLVLTTPRGVVVVAKPSYPAGCVRLPTGGIEKGESPADAAKREFMEEFGGSSDLRQIAEITYASSDFATHVFLGELAETPVTAPDDEHSEIRSVPLAGLSNLAARLEELDDSPRPGGTHSWREWGVFRSVAHSVANELLAAFREPPQKAEPPSLARASQPTANPSIQLLGQVQVVHSGSTPISLTGKHAQILSALALMSPQQLSKDLLREWFWDGVGSNEAIFTAVSRMLKKTALSKDDVETVGDRYLLNSARVGIDSIAFTERLDTAREAHRDGRLSDAARDCKEALSLWRGRPGGGWLDDVPELAGTIASLVEAHIAADELAIEIDLDDHRPQQAALRAQALCLDHPYRETLWGHYALALYRSGQQREALNALQVVRRSLRDEFGVAPGPALTELEQKILEQDPSLLPPERATYRSDKSELQMYWGYRPAAHSDIRESLTTADQKIVVAGLGLSTIIDILNDPAVVDHIVRANLDLTLVVGSSSLSARASERGGKHLALKLDLAHSGLDQLSRNLKARGHSGSNELLTYDDGVTPRHFFLHTGHSLYVGSYLTHQQGSHSYLMKLRDQGDQLFSLFVAELAHVLENTHPLPFA